MSEFNSLTGTVNTLVSNAIPDSQVSKPDPNQFLSPQLIYGIVAVSVIIALTQFTTKLIESITKLIDSLINK